jgi:hypothetical protein
MPNEYSMSTISGQADLAALPKGGNWGIRAEGTKLFGGCNAALKFPAFD